MGGWLLASGVCIVASSGCGLVLVLSVMAAWLVMVMPGFVPWRCQICLSFCEMNPNPNNE